MDAQSSSSSTASSSIRDLISKRVPREALVLHSQIRRHGVCVLGVLPLILKACASLSLMNHGKALHCDSVKSGVHFDVVVGTSVMGMYAKCGDIVDARKVFDEMPHRNVVSWNAMISGYLASNDVFSALSLFDRMPHRTDITWNEMIRGFAKVGDTTMAKALFDEVGNEMRSVVTWTIMVDGYARNGEMEAAGKVFEDMPERNFFVWSVLISGYCKQGQIEQANAIFHKCPRRNLVIWNSLISGLARNGFCEEAIEAYHKMSNEGFDPDEVTVVSVLSACSQLGLLDLGKEVHIMICENGISRNHFVLNALVDMYAKCGDLATAMSVFEGIPRRNTACWNSLISAFASHGKCQEAIELFHKMVDEGANPDEITFLSLLSGCDHGGLVPEGLDIFSNMHRYGVIASVKVYGCMIDLLGRAGKLKEAFDLLKNMPMRPNDTIWGSLLGACRLHLDDTFVKDAIEDFSNVDSETDSHYVLLSNIYAARERWEKAEETRKVMDDRGLKKTHGSSSC